jgi:tRNA A-37 threonylcarbamoyl transferase component Bud32
MTLLEATLFGSFAGVLLLSARRLMTRAYLRVNHRYRPLLERHGLMSPRALLRIPAVIISGHPDRNVSRVTLGTGTESVSAFLKREHRVRWMQRLLNLVSGFGLVSLSQREAWALDGLRRAGIGCPAWIAVGADGQGRAFLLVEELNGCVALPRFLADSSLPSGERRRFGCHLGVTLARLHNAGFAHRDLYAKHILVRPDNQSLYFLDWQRSYPRHQLTAAERCRDLAALEATLAEGWATPCERRLCFRAYCRSANIGRRSRRNAITAIREQCRLLSQRRHIREARQLPETKVKQELIWLDGEALCVTPDYYAQWSGALPSTRHGGPGRNQVSRERVWLPEGRQALFARRRTVRFFAWLPACFGGKPLIAPEVRQAGLLFRLQRYGVRTARLLAFGQRPARRWKMESFLLTEAPAGARAVLDELGDDRVPWKNRRDLLCESGATLQRLHAAGCYLRRDASVEDDFLTVSKSAETASCEPTMTVTLVRIDCVQLHRRPSQAKAVRDLAVLRRRADQMHLSRSEKLRVLLNYLGIRRLTGDAKRVASLIESQYQKEIRA